jgi:hypothetical protein
MLGEYIADDLQNGTLNQAVAGRVNVMKAALPDWYLRELAACAAAAGVEKDALLYAQCEGDVKSLHGCTTYVAFGTATGDERVELGRNFDYWGLTSLAECVQIFAVWPQRADGHAFVSVGWSGILGGWTFFNEKGLFVANNLGGFSEKNPRGVPTLILARILAQKAANVKEAVEIIKQTPRMRGQVLILGQAGDPLAGILPAAAVVRYDAQRVEVEDAAAGWAFHSSLGTNPEPLRKILRQTNRKATDAILAAGNRITLHSVAIRPVEAALWVAHGKRPAAQEGEYVKYDLRVLLNDQR